MTGARPDMTEHGWERDGWPAISEQVIAADILVLFCPIWLGEKSSVCTQVIERLYGNSHLLNDEGQYTYYGRTAGCLITGNEDGAKTCARCTSTARSSARRRSHTPERSPIGRSRSWSATACRSTRLCESTKPSAMSGPASGNQPRPVQPAATTKRPRPAFA